MSTNTALPRHEYHPNAYRFVFEALRFTQDRLDRATGLTSEDEADAHISGPELLDGIRQLGQKQFGWLTKTVFNQWGVNSTDDFGRIVFELIERGEMRKTDQDHLTDFFGVYDFTEAFELDYQFDTSEAFTSQSTD